MRGNHPGNYSHVPWILRNKRLPADLSSASPVTRQQPQRFDATPILDASWFIYRAPKMLPPSSDTVPTRQGAQRVEALPATDDVWFRQVAPKTLPPTASPVPTRQPEQRHSPLPDFNALWWQEVPPPRGNPAIVTASRVPTRQPSQRFDPPFIPAHSHWQTFRKLTAEAFRFRVTAPRPEFPPEPWQVGSWYQPRRVFPLTPFVAYRATPWPYPQPTPPLLEWRTRPRQPFTLFVPFKATRPQPVQPDFAASWFEYRRLHLPSLITASVVPTRQPSQRHDPLPSFLHQWWQAPCRDRMRTVDWLTTLRPDNRPMGRGRVDGGQAVTGG